MQVRLFTHNDLDGVGCAILAKLVYQDDVVIQLCNYDDIDSNIRWTLKNNAGVFREYHITDISISDETASMLDNSCIDCVLLDHHPTADRLNAYDWCKVRQYGNNQDIKTSGTEMYYNWLIEHKLLIKTEALDRFVTIVRDYDTWRWESLGKIGFVCKEINNLYHLYGSDKFINDCINKINTNTFPAITDTDRLILDMNQKHIDDYIATKNGQLKTHNICNRVCGVVFADKYFSELGNKLCKLHSEVDFVAIVDLGNKTISYRTIKDDIDLGKEIASKFGGGGHPKAAGSPINGYIWAKVINEIFHN